LNRYLYTNSDPENLHDSNGHAAAELAVTLLFLTALPVKVYVGNPHEGVWIQTTASLALGLKVSCFFWTVANSLASATYSALGTGGKAAPPPYPWTYCVQE